MKKSLKKAVWISYFIALSMTFVVLYYGSYYFALKYMTSDNIITREQLQENNPAVENQSYSYNSINEVNSDMDYVITNKTNYIEESYNLDTDELIKQRIPVPIEILGYNRQELIDYLTTYLSKNPEETLVNIQLVSFSPDSVVIRKTIHTREKKYSYYVMEEDGVITVYKADRKTKYIDTGINIKDVDEKNKKRLTEGFYIEDIHELYNFLENLTS